jgi:glyoxylase-like metal-dependent hydrolase (beta-lactamase superfamily II)
MLVQNGFTRRDMFRFGAMTAAATLLPTRAFSDDAAVAATPDLQRTGDLQGAGFYRYKVGDFDVTLLSDGFFPMDPAGLFAQSASADQAAAAAKDAFLQENQPATGHVNGLLIQSGRDNILIDTGCGSGFGPTTGKLAARLALAGITPGEITAIILTHLHPDHVGGLVSPIGEFALPNAKVIVTPTEKAFWSQPAPDLSKSGVPDGMRPMMIAAASQSLQLTAERLQPIEAGRSVVAGVKLLDAPGHTPGHVAVHLESGPHELVYISDLLHLPQVQFSRPDWHVAFDADPVQATATRKLFLDRIASNRTLIAGSHLPFPALGHVRARGGAYEWVPATWQWPA